MVTTQNTLWPLSLCRLATLALVLCFTMCRALNLTSNNDNGQFVCHLFKRVSSYQLMEEHAIEVVENYECFQGDFSYDISLPQDFINSHPNLDHGGTSILISGGRIKDSTVTFLPNATITVLPNEQRLLTRKKTKGNVTLLVVRAKEWGIPELRPNAKIREMVFGNVAGTLARQMYECSFGKFNIEKAQGPGIVDGLLEVNLPFDLHGRWNREVERDHLIPLLAPYGGESAFDHVAYCIPYGTYSGRNRSGSVNWLAYAIVNQARSVFNHFWCGLLTGTMHELGHNLGLYHAGQEGWNYGDASGAMGYSEYKEYGPRLCFNAQKNAHLGWYDDRFLDLSSSIHNNPWNGRLVAFVDYNVTSPDDVVLIQVGNLYLQYNRARDFNEGTREYANRVVIVSDPPTGSSASNLEAALAHNIAVSTFTYANFDGTGHDLVFKVCDQVQGPPVDYVELSIHLNNGTQSTTCTPHRNLRLFK